MLDSSYKGSVLDGKPGVIIGSYSDSDILFSLGGDGTFLRTAHKHLGENIPMIGVNLGTIGFLTEIHKDDFEDAVEQVQNLVQEHKNNIYQDLYSALSSKDI